MSLNRIGVFIDGDNISANYAEMILDLGRKLGDIVTIVTYYRGGTNSAWSRLPDFGPLPCAAAKNSADFSLSFAMIEALARGECDRFMLCSGDGDFTHVLRWMQDRSVPVHVVGAVMISSEASRLATTVKVMDPDRKIASRTRKRKSAESKLHQAINAVIESHGGEMSLMEFGMEMKQRYGMGAKVSGYSNWRRFFVESDAIYWIGPKAADTRIGLRDPGFVIDVPVPEISAPRRDVLMLKSAA